VFIGGQFSAALLSSRHPDTEKADPLTRRGFFQGDTGS